MKDTEGLWLRETWKRKGTLECLHPELSPERSFSGVITGAYICTTCGHLLTMERYRMRSRQRCTTSRL